MLTWHVVLLTECVVCVCRIMESFVSKQWKTMNNSKLEEISESHFHLVCIHRPPLFTVSAKQRPDANNSGKIGKVLSAVVERKKER